MPRTKPQSMREVPLWPVNNDPLYNMINNGLASSKIHRTMSPWAAPVLFTAKKDDNFHCEEHIPSETANGTG